MDAVTLGIISSLATSAAVAAMFDLGPTFARALTRLAARRLAPEERDRYQEEWLADLNERGSTISKIFAAFGFLIASVRIRSAETTGRQSLWSFLATRYHALRELRKLEKDLDYIVDLSNKNRAEVLLQQAHVREMLLQVEELRDRFTSRIGKD
jgi:hypothetical protein